VRKAAADERQPRECSEQMSTEGAEVFFPLFDCSLPLAADRAGVAAYFVVARRRRACRLAPPQHGGARSGASDDDGGGFSMFAPPICRRRWRNTFFRSVRSDEDGGNPANIAASGSEQSGRARCASSSAEKGC
jgi:hypothetical protein